jgi:hypothetical protein
MGMIQMAEYAEQQDQIKYHVAISEREFDIIFNALTEYIRLMNSRMPSLLEHGITARLAHRKATSYAVELQKKLLNL